MPVLRGADHATLNIGAGWLPGTAAPGEPGNVAIAPTASPALTLITCYPFYFVGSAPQRFIVRAQLTATRPYATNPIHEGDPA